MGIEKHNLAPEPKCPSLPEKHHIFWKLYGKITLRAATQAVEL